MHALALPVAEVTGLAPWDGETAADEAPDAFGEAATVAAAVAALDALGAFDVLGAAVGAFDVLGAEVGPFEGVAAAVGPFEGVAAGVGAFEGVAAADAEKGLRDWVILSRLQVILTPVEVVAQV